MSAVCGKSVASDSPPFPGPCTSRAAYTLPGNLALHRVRSSAAVVLVLKISATDHSALSASAGSNLAARRAGIAAAISAASTSNTGAADNIIGSHGVTPNN